jgi:hypothetical protein
MFAASQCGSHRLTRRIRRDFESSAKKSDRGGTRGATFARRATVGILRLYSRAKDGGPEQRRLEPDRIRKSGPRPKPGPLGTRRPAAGQWIAVTCVIVNVPPTNRGEPLPLSTAHEIEMGPAAVSVVEP